MFTLAENGDVIMLAGPLAPPVIVQSHRTDATLLSGGVPGLSGHPVGPTRCILGEDFSSQTIEALDYDYLSLLFAIERSDGNVLVGSIGQELLLGPGGVFSPLGQSVTYRIAAAQTYVPDVAYTLDSHFDIHLTNILSGTSVKLGRLNAEDPYRGMTYLTVSANGASLVVMSSVRDIGPAVGTVEVEPTLFDKLA